MKTPQSPAPVSGRPLTAEDVEIIRDYWSAYADADWHLIPEAIRDDFDARLVAVGLAEWRAVTADDLDDAFAHDRGLEAGGSCLDLTALGYLAFKADADGWMSWSGGENPVGETKIDVRFASRDEECGLKAERLRWSIGHNLGDIIAFRLSRPASEQPDAEKRKAEYRQAIRDVNRMRDDGSLPSDQPVEAIGAGRDWSDWPRTSHDLRYEIGARPSEQVWATCPFCTNEIDQSCDVAIISHEGFLALAHTACIPDECRAALSPASPARTPMGEPVAWIERQNDGTRYGEPKRWPPSDRARSYAQEMGRTIEPIYAAAPPARTPMGGPQVLKGVGKINGDGWKDTTTIGEVVYVWNAEKPSPYAPGQYPRIGNEGWSASTAQYDFSPASVDEVRALAAPTPMGETDALVDRFADALKAKLRAAGEKYGFDDAWKQDDWRDKLIEDLWRHVQKGDPRDVAAYCAFAWHHGWSLAEPTPMGGEVEALREAENEICPHGDNVPADLEPGEIWVCPRCDAEWHSDVPPTVQPVEGK